MASRCSACVPGRLGDERRLVRRDKLRYDPYQRVEASSSYSEEKVPVVRRATVAMRRTAGTKPPRDTGLGASSERLSGFGLWLCLFLAFAAAVRSLVQGCVWRIPVWPVHGFDELDVFVGHLRGA